MTTPGNHRISRAKEHHDATRDNAPACFMHELEPASVGEPDVRIKRIYDEPAKSDGCRMLVDRVWPRGIKKQDAALHGWLRDLAPSTELRKWFGHDPERWSEFRTRYRSQLRQHASELNGLRQLAVQRRVTLVYGAKDRQFNQAVVLKEVILES